MAQETRNVDYESMVDKYMKEWVSVHNVKFTCGKDVQVVIKRCSPEVLVRLLASYIKCSLHRDPSKALRAAGDARVARESAEQYRVQLEEYTTI